MSNMTQNFEHKLCKLLLLLLLSCAVQASAAEVRSQPPPYPPPYPPGPTLYPVHSPGPQQPPFVFAPHRLTPLPPQQASYHHQQHPPQQYQGAPQQHSLSRALSAGISEAESPAEGQVYSLRSRGPPRAESSALAQPHDQLQKPVHKVHHFFMCHTDQVCSPFHMFSQLCQVPQVECLCKVTLQHVSLICSWKVLIMA